MVVMKKTMTCKYKESKREIIDIDNLSFRFFTHHFSTKYPKVASTIETIKAIDQDVTKSIIMHESNG